MQADVITEAAKLRVLLEVDYFLSENPEWNEYRLQIAAGMDWKWLKRVRNGEPFSTRAGDKMLQAIAKIQAGEIAPPERAEKPKPKERKKGKKNERRERKRSLRGRAVAVEAEGGGEESQGQGESAGAEQCSE